MRILFIGNVVPDEMSLEIQANSLAGNKFQINMINSLKKKNNVDIISYVAVPLNDEQRNKLDNLSNEHEKYFYKNKNIFKSVLRFRKYIKSVSKNYDLVIVYNIAYPWIGVNRLAKKIKRTLILADFSEACSYKNLFLKLYAIVCKRDIKRYNNVVGLSHDTKRFLNKNQKFLCVPGGIDMSLYENVNPVKHDGNYRIMYSGNLSKVTGVDMLIDAFISKNFKNADLIITGRGDLQDDIQKLNHKNIKYYGSILYDQYLDLLNNANILVNPRNMNLFENKNNFPSKIFEYLAVGKMVVSTNFVGSESFLNNFIFCESSIDSIADALDKAISEYDDNYIKIFNENRKKSYDYDWNNQCDKIINM